MIEQNEDEKEVTQSSPRISTSYLLRLYLLQQNLKQSNI